MALNRQEIIEYYKNFYLDLLPKRILSGNKTKDLAFYQAQYDADFAIALQKLQDQLTDIDKMSGVWLDTFGNTLAIDRFVSKNVIAAMNEEIKARILRSDGALNDEYFRLLLKLAYNGFYEKKTLQGLKNTLDISGLEVSIISNLNMTVNLFFKNESKLPEVVAVISIARAKNVLPIAMGVGFDKILGKIDLANIQIIADSTLLQNPDNPYVNTENILLGLADKTDVAYERGGQIINIGNLSLIVGTPSGRADPATSFDPNKPYTSSHLFFAYKGTLCEIGTSKNNAARLSPVYSPDPDGDYNINMLNLINNQSFLNGVDDMLINNDKAINVLAQHELDTVLCYLSEVIKSRMLMGITQYQWKIPSSVEPIKYPMHSLVNTYVKLERRKTFSTIYRSLADDNATLPNDAGSQWKEVISEDNIANLTAAQSSVERAESKWNDFLANDYLVTEEIINSNEIRHVGHDALIFHYTNGETVGVNSYDSVVNSSNFYDWSIYNFTDPQFYNKAGIYQSIVKVSNIRWLVTIEVFAKDTENILILTRWTDQTGSGLTHPASDYKAIIKVDSSGTVTNTIQDWKETKVITFI